MSMQIPHGRLMPDTLQAIVREFVTRDGTDLSSVERRMESVLKQLESGRLELHFDSESESCNIVAARRHS